MAKLLESLALAGSRLADGSPNASGKAWVYVIGTTTGTNAFADADGTTALTQPITLDAAGRATVYVNQAITLRIETASGASLQEIDVEDAAGPVLIRSLAFTGALPSGSQGAGGVTDLDAVLTSALSSFGGRDFKYAESTGATQRTMGSWMREVHVSVKDYGTVGDGVHDDTTAIQNATNRVLALGGGTVFFPPGTYLISSAITLASASSMFFRGAGPSSVIKNSGAVANALTFSSCTDVAVEQIKISHASGSTGYAISVADCTNITLRSVTIAAGHARGVSLTGTTARSRIVECNITVTSGATNVGVYYSASFYHAIALSTIVPTAGGKLVSYDGTTSYATIMACLFTQTAQGGIVWESTLTGVFFTVTNCPSLSQFAGALAPAYLVNTATIPCISVWGNGTGAGNAANVASGGTYTPVLYADYSTIVTGTTTGIAYIVAAPNPALHASMAGTVVTMRFKNAAGGAITGWNFAGAPIYHLTGGGPSTVDGQTTTVLFLWDGTVLRQITQGATVT